MLNLVAELRRVELGAAPWALSSLRFSEDLLRQPDQESLPTLESVRAGGSGIEVARHSPLF